MAENRDTTIIQQRWMDAVLEGCSSEKPLPKQNGHGVLQWAEIASIPDESQLRALADVLGIPYQESIDAGNVSSKFVETVPIGFARRHCILVLEPDEGSARVALGNPQGWELLDVVARRMGIALEPFFSDPAHVLAAINTAYQRRTSKADSLLSDLDRKEDLEEVIEVDGRQDLLDVDGNATVIKLVSSLLFEAVRAGASDVHVQPYEDRLVVRQRVDGVLFESFEAPKSLQDEIISRIKIIGKLNIAEKRLPQDGRTSVKLGSRNIDLRIASLPTSHGERIVIRLLDKGARLYTLNELGMEQRLLGEFRKLIGLEHGLILVTGPTGSGKSTTLYAGLQEINATDLNVVTLEDPIEYELDGISQTQINEKKGMTFARGLRSVLRQDPDIIMVGEIRDHETAEMAIQSALTGHLVFSTLHTNDAPSAVTRLIDLGIEPYLVASSLVAVLAQRLVRRICQDCATSYIPERGSLEVLGLDHDAIVGQPFWHGSGCDSCRGTGYSGRVGIFELLAATEAVRGKIGEQASSGEIREAAESEGMRPMRDDGIARILNRGTTIEEVTRVTMRTST